MTWQSISTSAFFTVALPIIITLFINGFWQNKRIDDLRDAMNQRFNAVDKRFDAVDRRLEKIEAKLDNHAERISKLEGPALVRSGL